VKKRLYLWLSIFVLISGCSAFRIQGEIAGRKALLAGS
jgi:hypothetical protein